MRPVHLDRVIQTAWFAEMTRAFSTDELAEFLGSSGKRAEEIAGEAVKIGLIEMNGSNYCETPACSVFLMCVREEYRRSCRGCYCMCGKIGKGERVVLF